MKKVSLVFAAVLTAAALSACGGNGAAETTAASAAETTAQAESKAEETKAEETKAEESKASGDLEKMVVGASPAPHAEILEAAKPLMAEKGYDLQVMVYSDYVQPNNALDAGDLDANYFQHLPYLESFNEQHGTKLVSAAAIHYEPFGIYAGKTASLEEVADGAVVAVPNDVTNEARALLLLEAQGLITLKEGAGLEATKNDIAENPKNLEIMEVEAAQIPRVLPDVDLAVINGNYAIEAGLKVSDALAIEDAESISATTYGNVLAVREGEEETDKTKALVEVLTSEEIKTFIDETYEGAVVPLF
ncbi:MAG: MetQ/NlpA family ABC transporter substrate-binding protein [Lachnospiraceae bacterium]